MKIAYLDGHRLRRALIAGTHRLIESAGRLNAINVFPVPDGDTGTNMAGTARTMALCLEGSAGAERGIGAAIRLAADAALRGARGNSGAIFAQFLHGLAEELKDELRISTRRFAEAARAAAARAHRALSRPREGTIITVLRDWAESLYRLSGCTDDFQDLMRDSVDAARASLARTPELLPELKRAGVVDAGAEGLVDLLEGILGFIRGGRIRGLSVSSEAAAEPADVGDDIATEPLSASEREAGSRRYCVECLLSGKDMDLGLLRDSLAAMGDSVVVAGSPTLAKVHLHTDEAPSAFRAVGRFGVAAAQKVDDMELQRRLVHRGKRPCAILSDSACDLPDALCLELCADRAPVTVELDGIAYLDRDGLSADEFYDRLAENPALAVSTSQPSHEIFSRKLDLLLGSADEVVYVGMSSALSGTFEAGRRAGLEGRRAGRVRAVDSRSISVGAAIVARRAAEAAMDGAPAAQVEALAASLVRRSRLLIAVPDLSGLMRTGRLAGIRALAARKLGLRPIISIDEQGRATSSGLYLGARRGARALLSALGRVLPEGSRLEAMIGHADASEEANALSRELALRYRLDRDVLVTQVSPALAAHAGRGALALAFLGPERC